MLVALVGLLVMRFVGFSFADIGSKSALHVVLLDDTLSMNDQWKENDTVRDAFQVAKRDVLFEKIAKSIGQAAAGDRLYLLTLSKIATDRDDKPKIYDKLNDPRRLEELKKDLDGLEASQIHVPMAVGLKKVQELVTANPNNRITVHVLSDFRERDWALPAAEPVNKILVEMAKDRPDLKIRLIDTVHPYRLSGQGASRSRMKMWELSICAGTKVVGKGMPVQFTATLANFSAREMEVNLVVLADGEEKFETDFSPSLPVKIRAGSVDTKVTFEQRFYPQIKAGDKYFTQITARLQNAQRGKLENDGLSQDNERHAAVEIRDKVPVLLIDGEGARGRQDNNDSFFLRTAIYSVPGASYEIENGDELAGGLPTKVLERADLAKYPTIFLANVRELTPRQLANLENYVRQGGGVCFFMGPLVNAGYYNKNLYKGGAGLFPAPLREIYYPPPNEEALRPQYTGDDQLLLREDLFGRLDAIPIFGAVLKDETQKMRFKDLPIRRYYQVVRSDWRQVPGKTFELATLPNDVLAKEYQKAALALVEGPIVENLLANEDLKKYRKGLERHHRMIKSIVDPTSEKKAFALASAIEAMLQDKGKEKDNGDFPNLTEFWSTTTYPKIGTLRKDAVDLRDQAKYGDPFVVARQFGKGKVVAVMTSAGKEWNEWGGGSDAAVLYQPFIWETQNYLSSQAQDANLTVGTPVQVAVDPALFKQKGAGQLELVRTFRKLSTGKRTHEDVPAGTQFGLEDKNSLVFNFDRTLNPGLYLANLHFAGAAGKAASLATYSHVYNVDTLKEGDLARVNYDDIDKNIIREAPTGAVLFEGPGVPADSLVARRTDLSESPWLFLLFIAILVTEQALAVHLSFHLKGNEADALTRATSAQVRQSAA